MRKLTLAMDKTRRYLDPIVVVREDRWLTPNGGHRLTALKELGARSVLALVVPEKQVAYQILALNIEKAYNLREKALEVGRMYRDLATRSIRRRARWRSSSRRPGSPRSASRTRSVRASRAAPTHPSSRRWTPSSRRSSAALAERERRARLVLELDDAVSEAVARLKERGFESPYLKAFVVARVNPLRFMKGGAPPFDELFAQMTKRARGMDPAKIRGEDVARSGGAAAEAE